MRERTPSADDTPKRAPPAPPREAPPVDVAGSQTSTGASVRPFLQSRMVASSHSLEELGVTHPASASSERQQQEKHGQPSIACKSAQTAQDKRSRLSSVINNLRKKVPENRTSDTRSEEDDRNSVERNLETLEKYVMTVLNGVIKDEEENRIEGHDRTKDPLEKGSSQDESRDVRKDDSKTDMTFEPSEPCESQMEAAVPMVHDLDQADKDVKKIQKDDPGDLVVCENPKDSQEATLLAEDTLSKDEVVDHLEKIVSGTKSPAVAEASNSMGNLEDMGPIEITDDHPKEERGPEGFELRTICRDLLNDLLNDINQLIDDNASEDADDNESLDSVCEDSFIGSEHSESSRTSLHCSLPLEKVASVLQNCQSDQSASLKSPSFTAKPPSPTVRHLCLYCDRKFLSISLRQRHTERVHQLGGGRRSERNFRKPSQNCQYCSDRCADSLDGLFQHMVGSHGDKYHACLQCNTRYLTRDALTTHMSDVHGSITERILQIDKIKEFLSCKETTNQHPRDKSAEIKEPIAAKDEPEAKSDNNSIKQIGITIPSVANAGKDNLSNPGSPEFDSSFYSSLSCNIRENLLHHIDGKLQASAAGPATPEAKQSLYEHSVNQIQFPIDISLTAATPVYSKEYPSEDYENSSEYAQKPGKTRTHPRRVSFEKYNFPRKYDGREQWTCSIKDLSKFDISTQLSLRKKQQLIKERLTINRLNQISLMNPSKTEVGQTDLATAQSSQVDGNSTSDDGIGADQIARSKIDKTHSINGDEQIDQLKSECSAKCSTVPYTGSSVSSSTSKPTEFSLEFGNFMRLKKWEDNAAESNKSQDIVYAELTGEWSRPRIYICGACATRHVTLREMEDHKASSHPNVWCSHFEFSGDQRELYKHLFLPGRSVATVKARNAFLSEKVCTKCAKNCNTLPELHRHMLECGGDQAWLQGLFGNGKKKCKWRPFGSRSRRRRQRGMKRNIQNSQAPRVNMPKERPPSGPRVRPSDRESIQKMLANLPPKRASRKVLQDTMTRSQGTLRNVQTRSRPRLTVENSSASALSRNKAALKNKLLKNAKSFQRNRCRVDNIAAAIESVVKDYSSGEEENDDEDVEEEADDEDEVLVNTAREKSGPRSQARQSRSRVRGVRVLSKKRNVRTKEIMRNVENSKTRETRVKSRLGGKSVANGRTSVSGESASVSGTGTPAKTNSKSVKASGKSDKSLENKLVTVDNVEGGQNVRNESLTSTSRRKKSVDPTASLNASIKAKSQLRTHDGKFARNPNKKSVNHVKKARDTSTNQIIMRPRRNAAGKLLTRSQLKAAGGAKRTSRRTTRLSSDSDKMPTLEPVADPESTEEDAEESGNELPILTPAASVPDERNLAPSRSSVSSRSDSGKKGVRYQSKHRKEMDSDEVIRKNVADLAVTKSKPQRRDGGRKSGRGRWKKRIPMIRKDSKDIDLKEVSKGEDNEDDMSLTDCSSEGTRQVGTRNRKNLTVGKPITEHEYLLERRRSSKESKTNDRSLEVPKRNVRDEIRVPRTRQDRRTESPDNSIRLLDVSPEVRRLLDPAVKEDLLAKLGLNSKDMQTKRSLRTGQKSRMTPTRIKGQKNSVPDESVIDSDSEKSSDPTKTAQRKTEKFQVLRKSPRNMDRKTPGIDRETPKPDVPEENESLEVATKDQNSLAFVKDTSERVSDEDQEVLRTKLNDSDDLSSMTKSALKLDEQLNSDTIQETKLQKCLPDRTEVPNPKSPKRSSSLGKRRGRIKSTALESDDLTDNSMTQEDSLEADAEDDQSTSSLINDEHQETDSKDVNVVESLKLVTADLVNISLEHLQQESSNSNVDSGKENSSETPVNIPKVKTVRPKKTKGARRDRVVKRTLSNVIGILTEGVNIPVEAQQSVVLTVQTSLDSNNPEAVQSSDEQANERNVVPGGPLNPDRGDKTNGNSDIGLDVTAGSGASSASSASETVTNIENEVKQESVSSSGVNSETDISLSVQFTSASSLDPQDNVDPHKDKVEETSTDHPANDIILDLSRRKPKGKGSFLEKIVSKIAKQKDVLLEGEVGSLLDSAADELTSILDEVGPALTEISNANVHEFDFDKNEEGHEDISTVTMCTDQDVAEKEFSENECLISSVDNCEVASSTSFIMDVTMKEDIAKDDTKESKEEDLLEKAKRKSKKRSLEINSPTKNKRKSVEEEVEEEFNEEEELCLADIMKLIQKPKESENMMEDAEGNQDGDDYTNEKVRPGKRKALEDDEEEEIVVENAATNNLPINIIEMNSSLSEYEAVEETKKSRNRKSSRRKSLTEEQQPVLVPEETEDPKVDIEKKSGKSDEEIQGLSPSKISGKRKSITDEDIKSDSENIEEPMTSCDSSTKRLSKRRSVLGDSVGVGTEGEKLKGESQKLLYDKIVEYESKISAENIFKMVEPSKSKDNEMSLDINVMETIDVPDGQISSLTCLLESSKFISQSLDEQKNVSVEWEERKNSQDNFDIGDLENTKILELQSTLLNFEKSTKRNSKRKSLADEHLELPDSPGENKILESPKKPFGDSPEDAKVTEEFNSPLKKKIFNRKSEADDTPQEDVSIPSCTLKTQKQSELTTGSLEPFKVPEVSEVLQHTKKRSSKRKTVTDVHLNFSEDQPPSESRYSPLTVSHVAVENSNNQEEMEIVKNLNDKEQSMKITEKDNEDILKEPEVFKLPDVTSSNRRRSFKRKNAGCNPSESPEDLSHQDQSPVRVADQTDNPHSSEAGYSMRKRSSKRKYLIDDLEDFPDDIYTDNPRMDINSIDAEKNSCFERRQTPKRKAKKNIPLIDEHLDLCDDLDIPDDLRSEEIYQEQTIRTVKVDNSNKSEKLNNSEDSLNSNTEKSSSEVVDDDNESCPVSSESNTEIPDTEDPTKEEFQTPKKRGSGNFAIVHTKSGEILIVEKKKKLTKEAPKFFCDVCATSFTRKSSLKKHNLSQSHLVQMGMAGKDQDKDNVDLNDDDSVNTSGFPGDSLDENDSSKSSDAEMATENSNDEEELNELDKISDKFTRDILTSLESQDLGDPPKISLTPQMSEEEALEEELLDEEICKITENMSHDEYVLTDHISPVLPEASSTPVTVSLKKAQDKTKKSKKDQEKKRNLAKEHLDLDSPTPINHSNISPGSFKDIEFIKKMPDDKIVESDTSQDKSTLEPSEIKFSKKETQNLEKHDSTKNHMESSLKKLDEEKSEEYTKGSIKIQETLRKGTKISDFKNIELHSDEKLEQKSKTNFSDVSLSIFSESNLKIQQEKEGSFQESPADDSTFEDPMKKCASVFQDSRKIVEQEGSSSSSFADKPLAEFLTKNVEKSDRRSSRKGTESELNFSNIAVKLRAQETSTTGTLTGTTLEMNNSFATEFDSDEMSMDTSMSVDIQKLLNDPELETDDKQITSQDNVEMKLATNPRDSSKSDCSHEKSFNSKRTKSNITTPCSTDADTSDNDSYIGNKKSRSQENKANGRKASKIQKTLRESNRKNRMVKTKSRRQYSSILTEDSSDSDEVDEDRIESRNKNKIVKSVFGRVFAGEKVDKVKEVLDDWDSRSELEDFQDKGSDIVCAGDENENANENATVAFILTPEVESKITSSGNRVNKARSCTVSDMDSASGKRSSLENNKRNRSRNARERRDSSLSEDRSRNNSSSRAAAKSRLSSDNQKRQEVQSNLSISSADVVLPSSRCRQSKKRAEERISRAFEEESTEFRRSSDCERSGRSRDLSYGLRNQTKLSSTPSKESMDSRSVRDEEQDSLDLLESSDPETEVTLKSVAKGRISSMKKTKKKDNKDWEDFTEEKQQVASTPLEKILGRKNLNSDSEDNITKPFQKAVELKSRDFIVRSPRSPRSPAQSSLAPSSIRNRSPTPDRNSQSSQEEDHEDEEDITRCRISPLFVLTSPETSMDSASNCNEIPVNQEVSISRKRSTSEFSGDKVVIRSPLSNNENTPEVVTIAPTDAVEDNALDVPQETLPQKSRQGKVLNFDEELFVECCSRLKATTENELRGAKKIKLDHSDGFHKKEDPSAFRSSRDRWRDVESQNSLGSLLESVNQLLGEEIYNTREKEYTKRARTLRSENSSRSVSPDAEISRPDNLGYEDSLDVAFEHNNKLRDKIQQRMRESEDLIASTFGQRNSESELPRKRAEEQDHEDGGTYGNTEERRDVSNLITKEEYLRERCDDRAESANLNDQNVKDIPLDSSGFKNKMNSALGGLLDKALSNLLHSNGKHDHNGSTPMKVLAELACARAPTSTSAESLQDTRKLSYNARGSVLDPPLNALKDPLVKKIRNPIKELFERKKEINERKYNEKSKAEAALKELNAQRQRKTKKTRRRQEFPLVRKGPHGGLVERKKRRDIFSKKDHSIGDEKIKDVYDFDEEESQMETGFGNVMPYRSKIEKSYEISCLRTKDVDVAGLMSKAIDETLENGVEGDVLGRRLESMIDKKFKEMEKFAPKTKGALKSFQADVKQDVTGPMDDYVERNKQRQKKSNEQTVKQMKIRKKNKSPKKKSRNAWYENDSSDEFRTAAKAADVGVGITKSQRTCSKGKQNLFAELSTSSESEYEENDMDYETKKRQIGRTAKKIVEDPVENADEQFDENKALIDTEENNETEAADLDQNRCDFSMASEKMRTDSETKKSESEMSEHPLVIDERKESDEQRNSDDDVDTPYDGSFELDDLYREDSSVSESDNEQPNKLEQNDQGNQSEKDLAFQDKSNSETICENKYLKENELIPLEEALDLLDRSEDLKTISEKPSEKMIMDSQLQETKSGTNLLEETSEPIEESQMNENDEEEEVEHHEEELIDLPEKLSTNEKPEKESENLPLHVFLSRKVQESKKRKQQQLRKLQEEQERILMDFQPTRRQRKCAIGKQGLLAEISSSDEESYSRETYRKFTEKSEQDRSRKPKRESKEKRKERYMEKKHEQMIAKEQKAIEEEILREVEKKKETFPKDNLDSDKDTSCRDESLNRKDQEEYKQSQTTKSKINHRKRQIKQKQKRPNEESQDNDQKDPVEHFGELNTNCDKVNAEIDFDYTKQKKQTRSPAKSRKTTKSDGKPANGSRKSRNSNSDRSKNRSISAHSKDPKDRRPSSAKWGSDDEELRTTKSWNKVEEGVGVAIGRRKRAAANQLYYWSSSSDEEEPIETAPTVEEEDDRQEQHGWIVGDSHKRMITMLAMEKQLKEKRRRSEDEFESGKAKNKKHRNSTS
ncbi:uncharacterized protein LOC107270087 isoform X2 [Cephus cinctus]|uniref:Uncharacterized protein LOC107270087 isoform X2 n=1 Tax=Cephus cinctus TaxID=211228 RepID=A0AAJ7C2G5_CEPCN|nr:uncharacterized protein LOC107270087 isoform X2 [Cephus cinctus]